MAEGIRELSQATFISTLAHSWGLHHHDVITSQKPLLLVPSLWMLEFNLWTLRRHKPSVHSIYWIRNSRDGVQQSVSYQALHVIQMYCLGPPVIPVRLLSRQAALIESFCHSAWNLAGVKGIEIEGIALHCAGIRQDVSYTGSTTAMSYPGGVFRMASCPLSVLVIWS